MKMYTSSELCKSCIHTDVCELDKNQCGDVFVIGHPSFFDNEELYKRFKEREKAGFPCKHYMSADVRENVHGEWILDGKEDEYIYKCSKCEFHLYANRCANPEESLKMFNYCPNCGADMREVEK